jgi:DNA-binding transcriptional LysR family regulator
MELRHLRYFLALAEEGHFGRAAQKLHIVQPALSMQIRSLEEELGAPLFTRTSRKVALTEAGEVLVAQARQTLAQAERAKEVVRRSARGESGLVRIGFAGGAPIGGKLSNDLRSFHRQSSEVELQLREMTAREQVDALLANEIDVGYCPSFDIPFPCELRARRVGSWPWLIALAGDHPLARRKRKLTRADLLDEAFVLYARHDADVDQLELLRRILGKEPLVAHRAANTLTVLTLAAGGLGLAVLPDFLARVTVPGVEYRPLETSARKADLVLLSRAQETSGAVKKYLALARTLAEPESA